MAQMVVQRAVQGVGTNVGRDNVKADNVDRVLQVMVDTRRRTIHMLRESARTADEIHQGCAFSNVGANVTGVAGGVCGVVAGVATLASGGLIFPLYLGAATATGAICSIVGGAWSGKNGYDQSERNSQLQKEILNQIMEDEKALRDMNEIIHRMERGDFGEPWDKIRELHLCFAGLGCIGMTYGSTTAIEMLEMALIPMACFISRESTSILSALVKFLPMISEKNVLKGMGEVAEESASSAVELMADGISKNFVRNEAMKAARKAYKEIIEEATERAAKEAAKRAAKEGGSYAAEKAAEEAAKEAVKKTAHQAATKAARQAAKKAAEEGAKTAAKVTGAVTMGFGAITIILEVCNAYQNYYESYKGSPLGKELHELATNLENSLLGQNASHQCPV